eukprot:1159842-Pelagomonas_calceolata.AAC.3
MVLVGANKSLSCLLGLCVLACALESLNCYWSGTQRLQAAAWGAAVAAADFKGGLAAVAAADFKKGLAAVAAADFRGALLWWLMAGGAPNKGEAAKHPWARVREHVSPGKMQGLVLIDAAQLYSHAGRQAQLDSISCDTAPPHRWQRGPKSLCSQQPLPAAAAGAAAVPGHRQPTGGNTHFCAIASTSILYIYTYSIHPYLFYRLTTQQAASSFETHPNARGSCLSGSQADA